MKSKPYDNEVQNLTYRLDKILSNTEVRGPLGLVMKLLLKGHDLDQTSWNSYPE